jgi:hypothetical protein
MAFTLKGATIALSLGIMTLTGLGSTAAQADGWREREHRREWREDRRDHRRDVREDRRENRQIRRSAYRQGYRDGYRRPSGVVYRYDYNRPDVRYGRYYRPERYYRSGYAPYRVTRGTRIYRGYDDRYYCRRSDGTTGLIVGAALGGLIGSQIDRGHSNTAGILIGGGAGALLGREIDRGSVNCR